MTVIDPMPLLSLGIPIWNNWRKSMETIADRQSKYLAFEGGKLKLYFEPLRLRGWDLRGADFRFVSFHESIFRAVNFAGADLRGADLSVCSFHECSFKNAYLQATNLWNTNFDDAYLTKANFSNAFIGLTKFGNNDLSEVIGLDTIRHSISSTIGLDTIYNSQGKIPEVFLRGCGISEDFITYMHSLVTSPIQHHSCFISYSHKDEDFVQRLYWRMRTAGLNVWYAAEDMAGGKKTYEQIEQAIQLHDRLLVVLSEHSLKSEWVMTEIRKARKQELNRGTRKLFPISLVDFAQIKEWECFDADTGKDLAVEVREYFIPDFSKWKDHDSFEAAFDRLFRDLKVEKKKD